MTIFRVSAAGISPGGDEWQFGMHLLKVGGTAGGALTAWSAAIDALWNGDGDTVLGVGQYYQTTVQLQSLVATALDPLTGKNATQAVGSDSLVGTGSGQGLPAAVAVCVSTRTALPTRAGRGRFYMPAPLVSVMLNGKFETSVVADYVAAAQLALDSLSASTYPAVIYHRSSMTSTAITSVDVGNVPDVQNRRRNKVVEARQSMPVS